MLGSINIQSLFAAASWLAVPLGLILFLILASPKNKGKQGIKPLTLVSLATFALFAIALKAAPRIWVSVAPYSPSTGFLTFAAIMQVVFDSILIGEIIFAIVLARRNR